MNYTRKKKKRRRKFKGKENKWQPDLILGFFGQVKKKKEQVKQKYCGCFYLKSRFYLTAKKKNYSISSIETAVNFALLIGSVSSSK